MSKKICGICFGNYTNLKQHLTYSHTIPNTKEFQLLMKYGSARTTSSLDCELCGKRGLVRLDKHLQEVHLVLAEEREPILKQAKRSAIVKELAELRSSSVDTPIVSSLDIGITNEFEDYVPVIGEEAIEELVDEEQLCEQEGSGCQQEENDASLDLKLDLSESSLKDCPHSEINLTHKRSTPTTVSGSHSSSSSHFSMSQSHPLHSAPVSGSHSSSSSHFSMSQSHPLHSTPVSGSHNSSSSHSSMTQSHQLPSMPLPGSTDRPSCNSELQSLSLQGNLCDGSEVLSGSVSKARTCNCECAQFASRLQQLEQKVDLLLTAEPQTSNSIIPKPPLSAQKREHVGKGKKTNCFYEKVLEDFMKFRLGPRTGIKDRDNARQTSSHAHRFCLYMAAGLPFNAISHDLRFLNQMDKLRTWPTYLTNKGYAPTTIKGMMTNVIMFFKHIENSFHAASKLKAKDLTKILYEMRRIQSDVQKKVVVHRQKVLRNKTDNQLEAVQEKAFMRVAKQRIPQLFKSLASDETLLNEHSKVMGYIMGYLCILTGHRSVVLTNMTKESVVNVERWSDGKRFQVLVGEHKTVRSFGQAALCLNKEEFKWLEHLTKGKCCVQGSGSDYVFHTVLGKQIVKPSNFLHLAWVDSGMKGSVTFNKIRSSVSTQANTHLTEKEKNQVAKSMCHDPKTADRFYVALPDKVTGYKTRKLRLKALKRAVANPAQDDETSVDDTDSSFEHQPDSRSSVSSDDTPETSSDDEEPILDDRPESGSSLSSEEMRIMRQKHQRTSHGSSVNPNDEVSSLSEEELLSFQIPHTESSKCKKRLAFSTALRQSGVPEELQLHIVSPSKCFVHVDKLREPIAEYFLNKMHATNYLLNQPRCQPDHVPAMNTGSVPAPPFLERQPPEGLPGTPPVENPGCVPEPVLQQMPDCVQETPADEMPETPPVENPGCVPEPVLQQMPDCVQETSAEESQGWWLTLPVLLDSVNRY